MSNAADHQRIWLEPGNGADKTVGRMWCQDNVWTGNTDYADAGPPTEYIRADIAEQAFAAIRLYAKSAKKTGDYPHDEQGCEAHEAVLSAFEALSNE